MELQKSFTPEYRDKLKYDVKQGNSLGKYALKQFPVDDAETISLKGIEKPDGLLAKLIPDQKYDLQNAIAVYEAFPSLSPLIAASEPFWAYLTHVDLFEFVQKRWNKVKENDVTIAYVNEHWFGTKGNALGTLWWAVCQTIDNSREDKYELTRTLFKQSDIFQNLTSSFVLFPNKNAVTAILEFFIEHHEILNTAINIRNRCIIQSLNRYGGVRKLSYLEKSDFKNILETNLSTILKINTKTELSSALSEWK